MSGKARLLIMQIMMLVYLFVPFTSYGPQLKVFALDVGQGDSTLIITPNNHKIIIDGGPDMSVISKLEQQLPFWDRSIDTIILTHPDLDHISGLIDIMQRYKVEQVVRTRAVSNTTAYKAFSYEIKRLGLKQYYLDSNNSIRIGGEAELKILWPMPASLTNNVAAQANDSSLVAALNYKNFSALFTGDIDAETLDMIDGMQPLPDIDVLKVPHHGSKYGLNSQQLSDLSPIISTISVGADNRYGHPASSTIDALNQTMSKIYRTDINGTITIIVDITGISASTE